MAKEVIELYTKEQMKQYGVDVLSADGGFGEPVFPTPAYTIKQGEAKEVLGDILKRRGIVTLSLSPEIFLSVAEEAMHTFHLQASVRKEWPSDEEIDIAAKEYKQTAIDNRDFNFNSGSFKDGIEWLKFHQQKPSNNK